MRWLFQIKLSNFSSYFQSSKKFDPPFIRLNFFNMIFDFGENEYIYKCQVCGWFNIWATMRWHTDILATLIGPHFTFERYPKDKGFMGKCLVTYTHHMFLFVLISLNLNGNRCCYLEPASVKFRNQNRFPDQVHQVFINGISDVLTLECEDGIEC